MKAVRIAAGMVMMAGVATFVGCASTPAGGPNWRVDRVDPTDRVDVHYRFNDEDARIVFHDMVADALSRPWVDNWMREHGGQRPIIFLGNVRNETQDYINTRMFTTQVQEELLNSGRVRVKAEREARAELRDERLDTRYNDPATIKAVAKELNADFALIGRILDNKQRSGDGRTIVNYYQANMELVNVETAEVVWINTSEIKKVARR